jgi:glycosyltransferase involved in cell wall biosynthesis
VKLLVFGHLSHTGFGTVTSEIASRLLALGVDVRVIAVNHRGEPVKGPLSGHVWPAGIYGDHFAANWSAQAITGEAWNVLEPGDEWKPDVVLAISDVSGLLSHIGRGVETWTQARVLHYCPIEGDNLPPSWKSIWTNVAEPVSMSDYGQRVISEHIGRPVPRIYHGVDTDAFYPVSPGKPIRWDGGVMRSKEECKRKFGLDPARKIILRTDRNVTRKNSAELLRAFSLIALGDPDVDLILHCQPIDAQGIDLVQELLRLPDAIRDRVKFTNAHDTFKGLPVEGLNALYNAADSYLTTTGGEGFGLTLAESLAAGVPVVSTGWAAEIEVIGDGGITVPPLHDSYGHPVVYHSGYGMDWAVPDPKAFTEPVLRLLGNKGARTALGQAGRLHVKRSFSWDEAATSFLDLITQPALEAAA